MMLTLAEITTTTLVLIAVAGALAGLAYILAPKPKKARELRDTSTPTLSTRGSWTNFLIGTARVAPVLAWAGNRVTRREGGGGGKGGGGGGGSQTIYYEDGWHILCVGPASRLQKIIIDGKTFWEGDLRRETSPSGTSVSVGTETFIIYWGEPDQPVNAYLGDATRVGVASRWPLVCYIEWRNKRLDTSPRWPQIEYVVTVEPVAALSQSPAYLQATDAAAQNEGVNPAHAIYQLLTAPSPHGAGVPTSAIDTGSLEALGQVCAEEHIPIRVIGQDGATVSDLLSEVLQEIGVFMPQIGGKLAFVPIRFQDPDTIPTLTADALVAPDPEITFDQGPLDADRVVFLYSDRTRAFKPMPAVVDEDAGDGDDVPRRATREVNMQTVIDRITAQKFADRRQFEQMANKSEYVLKVGFSGRALEPGQAFKVSNLGQLRVASKTMDASSAPVVIKAALDQYSVDPTGFFVGDQGIGGGAGQSTADLAVKIVEAPFPVAGDRIALLVARLRANPAATTAAVWVSTDNTTYAQIGAQAGWGYGGELRDAIADEVGTIIDVGPEVVAANGDIARAIDLTSDPGRWLTGDQVLLVGDEIMFVRAVEAFGTNYRLRGLVRARWGTARARHEPGATAYIMRRADLVAHAGALLDAGGVVYVKVQPAGTLLSDIAPIVVELDGRARAPYRVDNVRPLSVGTGTDASLSWRYRVRDGAGGAASERGWGEACGATPAVEGAFAVEIVDPSDGSVVRTATTTSPAYTYTAADRSTDFGGEPAAFQVRVRNVLGGYRSPAVTVSIPIV